jgi:hypothetical protein
MPVEALAGRPAALRAGGTYRGHGSRSQRFKVTQAMNAPVASSPMTMCSKIGDIERQPDTPTVMLLNLGNASINVIDFEVAQPVGGSLSGTIPPMSKMPAAGLPRLCRSITCGSGVALACRRMSADGRGIERLGRLDITL